MAKKIKVKKKLRLKKVTKKKVSKKKPKFRATRSSGKGVVNETAVAGLIEK